MQQMKPCHHHPQYYYTVADTTCVIQNMLLHMYRTYTYVTTVQFGEVCHVHPFLSFQWDETQVTAVERDSIQTIK